MLFCSSWPKGHHLTHRLKHTHSSPFFTPDSGITTHLSTVRQAAPCIEIGPWCLTSSFLKLLITSKGGKSMQRESTTWLGKTMKQRCISLSRHEINPILNLFKLTPSHHLSGKERLSRFARFGNQYRCWRVGHFACLYNLDEHGLLLSTGTWHWQEEKIEAISYHPEVSGSQLSLLLNKLIPPPNSHRKDLPIFPSISVISVFPSCYRRLQEKVSSNAWPIQGFNDPHRSLIRSAFWCTFLMEEHMESCRNCMIKIDGDIRVYSKYRYKQVSLSHSLLNLRRNLMSLIS